MLVWGPKTLEGQVVKEWKIVILWAGEIQIYQEKCEYFHFFYQLHWSLTVKTILSYCKVL